MLANVLVLGVLSASAYLIYLVVKRSDEREKEGKPPTVLEQYEVRKGTGRETYPLSQKIALFMLRLGISSAFWLSIVYHTLRFRFKNGCIFNSTRFRDIGDAAYKLTKSTMHESISW